MYTALDLSKFPNRSSLKRNYAYFFQTKDLQLHFICIFMNTECRSFWFYEGFKNTLLSPLCTRRCSIPDISNMLRSHITHCVLRYSVHWLGAVLMVVAQVNGSELISGWTALPDGTMFGQVTEFTQTDINQGYIFYQHQSENMEIKADTFTFQVGAYTSRLCGLAAYLTHITL